MSLRGVSLRAAAADAETEDEDAIRRSLALRPWERNVQGDAYGNSRPPSVPPKGNDVGALTVSEGGARKGLCRGGGPSGVSDRGDDDDDVLGVRPGVISSSEPHSGDEYQEAGGMSTGYS